MIRTNSVLQDLGAPSKTHLYSELVELAVTALGAASFGFFAYVLELLIAIEQNTSTGEK